MAESLAGYFLFFWSGVKAVGAGAAAWVLVSFIWAMVRRFCTVQ